MKKLLFLMFVVLLAAMLPLLSDDSLTRKFPVKAGETLEVNLKSGGTITISGWDREEASITLLPKNGKTQDSNFECQKTSAGVAVKVQYGGTVNVEIAVPVKYNLDLKTAGGGITIANIDGEINGRTMGGPLDLKNLKGKIDLKTMGGEIVLKDSDIDGRVKTYGGRVLLENVVGNVKGSSMGGNVIYKNVKSRSGESTGQVVHITTMGGAISVSDAPEGAQLKTMGGKIHVRAAKEFVDAKTMGGDIEINGIDGWVKAVTMGGNIEVTMTGNPAEKKRDVTLSSMGGNITLVVPAGLSMNIDIELEFTKNNSNKYKITSDFALTETISDKWEDTGHGEPRKTISGKAVVAGGKHKIKIKTINGNIFLKKGN